jgi:alanine racemase
VRRPEDLVVGERSPDRLAAAPPRDLRPTRAEIDLGALVENAAGVKARVGGAGVLAVIKADGYGHGAVAAARALTARAPIAGLAVSLAEEGVELRRAGVTGPILVMGGVYGGAHRELSALDLVPVVSDLADVEAFARAGRPVPVHVKLDTGMARLGVRPEHLDEFLDGIEQFPNVRIVGFMTHLASADTDPELTRLQLARLRAALPRVRARAHGPLLVHAANSAALLGFPESHLGAVRPGLALYTGVLRFVTAIAQLRDLVAGDTVSYGAHYRAAGPTRIATLPIGYADGYPRRLGAPVAGAPTDVLVRGRRCPVVGAVCMDMLMVDVTALGAEVAVGDEVVLVGRQGAEEITAAELAARAGLIEYEILCGVSKRVPRRYLG